MVKLVSWCAQCKPTCKAENRTDLQIHHLVENLDLALSSSRVTTCGQIGNLGSDFTVMSRIPTRSSFPVLRVNRYG